MLATIRYVTDIRVARKRTALIPFVVINNCTIIDAKTYSAIFKIHYILVVCTVPGGLVVRIRRSHRRGPGSIPGQGTAFFLPDLIKSSESQIQHVKDS